MLAIPKRNIMVDIETLSTLPQATVIQIGACIFDNVTGEIEDKFLVNIDKEDSANKGFNTEEKTLKWWATQNQEVFQGCLKDPLSIVAAMEKFHFFINKCDKETPIWSHATFDFVHLQNYLRAAFLPMMNYKMAYDIRTLTGLSGVNLNGYNWNAKSHNALDDCIFQVRYVTDMINVIRNSGSVQASASTPIATLNPNTSRNDEVVTKLPVWLKTN